jgi:hypothetical protein
VVVIGGIVEVDSCVAAAALVKGTDWTAPLTGALVVVVVELVVVVALVVVVEAGRWFSGCQGVEGTLR